MVDPYTVELVDPRGLSEADFVAFLSVVTAGNAVDPCSAREQIPQATALAIAKVSDQVVGVGAIKANTQERWDYAAGQARKAMHAFDLKTLELGYVAVVAEHRRKDLSRRLVACLLARYQGPLFATTSSNGMIKTLEWAKFTRYGQQWESERSPYPMLSLWLKN